MIVIGAAGALLMLWLCHSLYLLAPLFGHEADTAVIEAVTERTFVPRTLVDIEGLKKIPLFGDTEQSKPAVVQEVQPEEAVETQLNLTLKGLFTTKKPEIGQAIIANGRKEQLYQVGEELEGLAGVELTAVFADRIRLNNRGTAEVLYLYPDGVSALGKAAPLPANDERRFAEPAHIAADERNEYAQEPIEQGRKINDILRVVRERDKETGSMLGFRVLPGRDRDGFEASGLQINDVILAIDGERLTDLRTAMTVYRSKRNAIRMSLLIQRDAQEMILELDLSQ